MDPNSDILDAIVPAGRVLADARTQGLSPGNRNRLFRQDRLIVWNTLRATFAGWPDRVIAALLMLAALAIVHAWCADRPWRVAAWAALVAGVMIGMGAGRIVTTRLAFHTFDGLLAADALHPPIRWRYRIAWHGIGLAVLAVVTLTARPSLLVVSIPAYFAGVLFAALTDGFSIGRRITGAARLAWSLQTWSHRLIAGVAAAALLLLVVLPARALDATAAMAVVGIGTVVLALALTSVDDAIVRFMTLAGHGPRRILVRHGRGLASFLGVAVPGCWVLLGPFAGGIVAAMGTAMLLLLTLRLLAYRRHGKRFADLLVFSLTGLLLLVGYAMPVLLPFLALAMLWHLQRRGRTKVWLL